MKKNCQKKTCFHKLTLTILLKSTTISTSTIARKFFRFGQKQNPKQFLSSSKHRLQTQTTCCDKENLNPAIKLHCQCTVKTIIQGSIRGDLRVIVRNWTYLLAYSISQLNALQSFLYRGKGARWPVKSPESHLARSHIARNQGHVARNA